MSYKLSGSGPIYRINIQMGNASRTVAGFKLPEWGGFRAAFIYTDEGGQEMIAMEPYTDEAEVGPVPVDGDWCPLEDQQWRWENDEELKRLPRNGLVPHQFIVEFAQQ